MKKTLTAIAALAALIISAAAADLGPRWAFEDVSLATTYNITAGSTSNINHTIDCRKSQHVCVQVYLKQTGSGTDTHTITFEQSADASNWATVAGSKQTFTIAGNGTSAVVACTNLPVYAIPYLRLATFVNGDSGDAITNLAIRVGKKIDAP